MEEDSPLRRGSDAQEEDENFPYYVRPRRADAPKVDLPRKVNTTLVAPQIPNNVPLLMEIMPKLDKLKFEDFDTQLQDELKRAECMVPNQFDPSGAQLLKLMELAEGFSHTSFINLLFMPHFSHSLQVSTYMKQLLVCCHKGCLWID